MCHSLNGSDGTNTFIILSDYAYIYWYTKTTQLQTRNIQTHSSHRLYTIARLAQCMYKLQAIIITVRFSFCAASRKKTLQRFEQFLVLWCAPTENQLTNDLLYKHWPHYLNICDDKMRDRRPKTNPTVRGSWGHVSWKYGTFRDDFVQEKFRPIANVHSEVIREFLHKVRQMFSEL